MTPRLLPSESLIRRFLFRNSSICEYEVATAAVPGADEDESPGGGGLGGGGGGDDAIAAEGELTSLLLLVASLMNTVG